MPSHCGSSGSTSSCTTNAACVTVNVWPPMTMLALRGAGSELAATVKLIVCGPAPLAGTPVIHAGTPLLCPGAACCGVHRK